ncbi:hypothetical protein [Streptomyces hydrogenans]|uniref:Uncharacterized protein n=1 Tax=Streptomyces hydrogenans TaxID=1873719 RepID=A0ABQ3PA37_9ACTN|nr:hypothetical protein [Streptomyces hydrogenans]GHG08232.1 hypothetical protein GCM10018784_20860 [Streptomyces hydrogenans]GHI21889.1 hypothetical protein Shyd_32600 [Streptomyces hydrogenans]
MRHDGLHPSARRFGTLPALRSLPPAAPAERAAALNPAERAARRLAFDPADERARRVEAVVDRARAEFGPKAIVPGSLMA